VDGDLYAEMRLDWTGIGYRTEWLEVVRVLVAAVGCIHISCHGAYTDRVGSDQDHRLWGADYNKP
jgi:hypothetical protein